jgi:hypothetical protein
MTSLNSRLGIAWHLATGLGWLGLARSRRKFRYIQKINIFATDKIIICPAPV